MKEWYREAEKIRLENDMRPREETTDLTRCERFKKWAKENMFGLASTAISITGIVATIITLARSGLRKNS